MGVDKKAVGLLGGTFDPIHNGHLAIAKYVYQKLNLSSVEFIPNSIPPHQKKPIATEAQRRDMLEIALRGQNDFFLNDYELQTKEKPSYTFNTLRFLRDTRPSQPFCFILGHDALTSFNHWHRWQDLLSLTHIIVVNRNTETRSIDKPLKQWIEKNTISDVELLTKNKNGHIYFCNMHSVEISSSEIRQLLKKKADVTKLIPAAVYHYIESHHLYR